MSEPIIDPDARWITICGTHYLLVNPEPTQEDVQDAIDKGNKITIRVAYQPAGPGDYHMEGNLTVDPHHPCGRLTTNATVVERRLPWPG
jgi:hypothetical protein